MSNDQILKLPGISATLCYQCYRLILIQLSYLINAYYYNNYIFIFYALSSLLTWLRNNNILLYLSIVFKVDLIYI